MGVVRYEIKLKNILNMYVCSHSNHLHNKKTAILTPTPSTEMFRPI